MNECLINARLLDLYFGKLKNRPFGMFKKQGCGAIYYRGGTKLPCYKRVGKRWKLEINLEGNIHPQCIVVNLLWISQAELPCLTNNCRNCSNENEKKTFFVYDHSTRSANVVLSELINTAEYCKQNPRTVLSIIKLLVCTT